MGATASERIESSAAGAPAEESGNWQLFSSPWTWGGLLALGLYQVIPFSGEHRPFLERYLAGHPLEYIQAFLFLVGASILVGKVARLFIERQAAALPLPVVSDRVDGPEAAAAIVHGLNQLPRRMRTTWFAARLQDLADYLRYRPTGEALERHAQRLTEAAADWQHDSHAQLQTIIWAIPILGFLGTVMGITLAIANVTPEQLDTSLNSVTGGLAVAFDTTAVALTQSIVIVFAGFFVRRAEAQLLGGIDDRIFRGLVAPLAGAAQQSSPILEAENRAARELLSRTQVLIEQQTGLWRESVDGLRERWADTLDAQQQELTAALSGGVQSTLGNHAELLLKLREEFVAVYARISTETQQQLVESREFHLAQQQELRRTWEQAWNEIRTELSTERAARSTETEQLIGGFSAQVQVMTDRLADATAGIENQLQAAARQTELLAQVVGQEEQLTGLQQRLTDNLEAVRAAETLQETLHSLNAAIHLLTARAKPKAA